MNDGDEKNEGSGLTVDKDGRRHYHMIAETGYFRLTGGDARLTISAWIYLHDGTSRYGDALAKILNDASDRAVGVMAGAFVEEHLTAVLQARMVNNAQKSGEMFGFSGPLGTFGAKINLAFLTGLISTEAHLELSLIAKVRNAFAHRLEVNSFDDQPIRDHCPKLTLWERTPIKLERTPGSPLGVRLGHMIGGELQTTENELLLIAPTGNPLTHRARFVNACKFYLAGLTMLKELSKEPTAPVF